ncbi:odorant receptor Or2-like [Schistocerca gregaria]|uniref:odorant receptor Or2-like n=1 Tax=Schistocerca gregaria TaxID=7010 RepID=UPI00211DC138|nr:odorant receptor Or2-like [Schistocerca gregaria]
MKEGGGARRHLTTPLRPACGSAATAAAAAEASDLDYLLRMLHWTGSMRHPRAGTWANRAFRPLNAAVVAVISLLVCSLGLAMWRAGAADLDSFTLLLSHCNSFTMWVVRLGIIAAHERDFHYLARQVERDFVEFLTAEDVPLLRDHGHRLRRVLKAYLCFGAAGSMWWLVFPVMCFGFTVEGVPFEMVLPYDVTRPLVFIVNWIFCAIATLHTAIMTMASDSFSVSLIVQLRLQLRILSRNLVNVAKGDEEIKEKKFIENSFLTETWSHTSQLQDRIRQNIRHHQTIIRNAKLLEKCLAATLLAQSVSIGVAVCIQLYQIAMRAQQLVDAGKFGCYLFIMLAQLFVFCWFGDDLITESQEVSVAAYHSVTSLEGCPISTKRSLLLLMLRAQRPLHVTAAGFFPLSRESFVAILNMSYSFCAILRNFKEE